MRQEGCQSEILEILKRGVARIYIGGNYKEILEIQNRGMTRGRKGLGLHHWSLVHQGDAAGSSAASLRGESERR